MQTSDGIESDLVVRDLSRIAAQAAKDLEMAKQDLRERELELKEMAEIFNQKILAATKVNHDLQQKAAMLLELSNNLQAQNDELQQKNKELTIKETTYNNLNKELRLELERVTQKEKELDIRRQFLETQIQEKTSDLIKSEKMATIGELTSRLAHDLRNPLTVIKSTHAIMKEKPNMKIEDRLKYNSRIDRALRRIVHLVDDVLDFVRISEVEIKKISLLSVLDAAIDSIDVPERITIIQPKYDIEIYGDMRKLEAVFSNLITNSIQAMNNEGRVEIRFTTKDENVIIEVEDSGPGMSSSIINKIFEPLFTTKPYGTGLGLAICKTVVEQHNGKISAKSNPTTFTITLPKIYDSQSDK
jgi:two-component system sensor histidine kinase HydH